MDEPAMTSWFRRQAEADLEQARKLAATMLPQLSEDRPEGENILGMRLYRRAKEEGANAKAKLAIIAEHGSEHMCFQDGSNGNAWDWYIGDCRVMCHLVAGYRFREGYDTAWGQQDDAGTARIEE